MSGPPSSLPGSTRKTHIREHALAACRVPGAAARGSPMRKERGERPRSAPAPRDPWRHGHPAPAPAASPSAHESPRKSWKRMRPCVVSASKLGASSPSSSPGMMAAPGAIPDPTPGAAPGAAAAPSAPARRPAPSAGT